MLKQLLAQVGQGGEGGQDGTQGGGQIHVVGPKPRSTNPINRWLVNNLPVIGGLSRAQG